MPKPTVSVVMASSRVGQATVAALLEKHADEVTVRAVFRSPQKAADLEPLPGVEIVVGVDAFDPTSHERAFAGAGKALIVAPQAENRHEVVNALLDGAKRHGVTHVAFVGGVFQEEEKFLFHRHWMASRRHAERLGLVWSQLECSDFMENLYRNQTAIREQSTFIVAGAQGLSAPVALSDIGRAAASLLANQEGAANSRGYRIVGGQVLSPVDIAGILSARLGRPIACVDVGVREARQAAVDGGLLPKWQSEGFYDWVELYFISGRLKNVESDLPLLGITPTSFEEWFKSREADFR